MKSETPSTSKPQPAKRRVFGWRQAVYLALIILIGWYVVKNWAELSRVVTEIRHGIWYWLLLAIVLQVIHFICHALAIRGAFHALNMPRKGRELLPVALGMVTVNVVVHTLNLSGLLYLVDDAKRRGHSAVSSFVAAVLVTLIDGLVIVAFALAVVVAYGIIATANLSIIIGATVLFGLVGFFLVLLFYFWRRPAKLERWLHKIGKHRAEGWIREWREVSKQRPHPRSFLSIFFWAGWSHVTSWLSLAALFLAFGLSGGLLESALAYTVSVISLILSPTPMGIGFVEGALAVTLTGQGYALATATAVTLAFRGFSFWLPFLIGALLLHRMNGAYPENHAKQN